jgi:hypothetical protein
VPLKEAYLSHCIHQRITAAWIQFLGDQAVPYDGFLPVAGGSRDSAHHTLAASKTQQPMPPSSVLPMCCSGYHHLPTLFFPFTCPGRLATVQVQYATIQFAFTTRGSCLKCPARIGWPNVLPSITAFISDRHPPAADFRKRLTQTPGQDAPPGSSLPFATAVRILRPRNPGVILFGMAFIVSGLDDGRSDSRGVPSDLRHY